ncbi:hypothetical protein PRN20_00350 [Devosia sp. ZB163]|jgi:hypothetical protein|uniref:hypothetical protein n=1 Tax=Devosia sp. ZB163 TaxID=3025938 RepID=UPI0023618C2A|nr:hypothetical protein [Devosia sp. ZB163]MDC9822167.1 hypothetical protein [Devosia sp. ZB163]
MRKLTALIIAASMAGSIYAVPTISFAMDCSLLCYGFYPPQSLLSDRNDDDQCERRVNDSGGFCTKNGKLNLGKDVPTREDYLRRYHRQRTDLRWW